jgi:hypothetical protein
MAGSVTHGFAQRSVMQAKLRQLLARSKLEIMRDEVAFGHQKFRRLLADSEAREKNHRENDKASEEVH